MRRSGSVGSPSRRSRRRICVAGLVLGALLVLPAPHDAEARGHTFVANCGNVGFLELEPDYWSYGCTSGSPLVKPLQWVRYGERRAVARGKAIVQNCGCFDPTAVRHYPARLVFSKPRRCPNDGAWRYFVKVRLTITYPRSNPFGKSAGASRGTFITTPGSCGTTD